MTSPSECRIELRVRKGFKSIARGIRVNGFELPNVASVQVSYETRDVRRVTVVFIPTDVIEVDEEDW